MTKFKYITIKKKLKRIRYLNIYSKKNIYLVFLHGFIRFRFFKKKPKTLFNVFAKKNKLGFWHLNIQVMENPVEDVSIYQREYFKMDKRNKFFDKKVY